MTETAEGLDRRTGLSIGTIVLGAIALYAVADFTELWSGAISGDHANTILESNSVNEIKEAVRTKKMILEHVFGGLGGTGAPPDPDDDDGFTRIFARAAIYAGVIRAVTKKLGLAPSAGSRWASGKNRPPRYARRTVLQTLEETIAEMFGGKKS